jgi:hypothetical protein
MIIIQAGSLAVNGGLLEVGTDTITGYLQTTGAGTLVMTNAADEVRVHRGGATFYGGNSSGLLTAGRLVIDNAYLETCSEGCVAPVGQFAPSGTHRTVFTGALNTVALRRPASEFFQDVEIAGGTEVSLGISAVINGTLQHGTGTGTATISSGFSALLTVSGLNQAGATTPMTFSDVALRFVDGTPNATFENVTFQGLAGYAGAVVETARTSGGPYTFRSLDFSALTGLSTGAVFVMNSGSPLLNILTSTLPAPPFIGTPFTGNVIWTP